MNIRPIPAILLLTILLSGCGTPVPADKADYVGAWSSPKMRLSIARDGNINYERHRGSTRTAIEDGPLQEFHGNDFSVGFWFISTTFVVSQPPYQTGGKWKMVVDGVELTKD